MPNLMMNMIRFWCPCGEECGRNQSYLGDAEDDGSNNWKWRLRQHLTTQPNHKRQGYDETQLQLFIDAAEGALERFEKEVHIPSPSRPAKKPRQGSRGKGAGGDVEGANSSSAHAAPSRRRSLPRSRSRGRNDASSSRRRSRTHSRSRSRSRRADRIQLNETLAVIAGALTVAPKSGAVPIGFGAPQQHTPVPPQHHHLSLAGGHGIGAVVPPTVTLSRNTVTNCIEMCMRAEENLNDAAKVCIQASSAFTKSASALQSIRQQFMTVLQ